MLKTVLTLQKKTDSFVDTKSIRLSSIVKMLSLCLPREKLIQIEN